MQAISKAPSTPVVGPVSTRKSTWQRRTRQVNCGCSCRFFYSRVTENSLKANDEGFVARPNCASGAVVHFFNVAIQSLLLQMCLQFEDEGAKSSQKSYK
ncbi:hypothetical protein TYRP_002098 [Tyrophagus putrescentiae]|nr:hypothetical protein TYRP_002098 [Tyrophagus putrescentiae]